MPQKIPRLSRAKIAIYIFADMVPLLSCEFCGVVLNCFRECDYPVSKLCVVFLLKPSFSRLCLASHMCVRRLSIVFTPRSCTTSLEAFPTSDRRVCVHCSRSAIGS